MSSTSMSAELTELIADHFKALGERARLQLLNAMRDGERTVNDLVEMTGLTQANVSKHLHQLHALGFLKRRRDGLFTFYGIADESVFRMCALICGPLERRRPRDHGPLGSASGR